MTTANLAREAVTGDEGSTVSSGSSGLSHHAVASLAGAATESYQAAITSALAALEPAVGMPPLQNCQGTRFLYTTRFRFFCRVT